MATLGSVARSIQYPNSGPNYKIELCPKFKLFSEHEPESKIVYDQSSYERVRARKKDVFASITKCDVNPIFPKDEILDHVLEMVEEYLSPYLCSTIGYCEDSEFNLGTAAGYCYLRKGYKSKAEAIQSKMFADLFGRDDFVPLATIADKDEFLPKEDLERGKIRTIFVDPLDKLAKTKFFFDRQNKKIIKHHDELWIKYGMTKQFGGFHRFARDLEEFELRDQSDVSGWDRTVFLYYVYYIRWKLLKLPERFESKFWYVVFHTIFPSAISPDGTVFMRQTGNNSGGNNTASDNSLAHLIVLFYFLIKCYYLKNQKLLTLQEIMNNAFFGIYSDDQAGSLNYRFFGWCSEDDYVSDKIQAYADWGLLIKPSASLVTLGRPGSRIDPRHEFLGSYFHFDEECARYLPYPRIGKICASITRIGMNSKLTEDEFFERVLALTFLSLPCIKVFDVLVKYLEFLYHIAKHKCVLRQILLVNDLTFMKQSFLCMHLGWESLISFSPVIFKCNFIFFTAHGGGGFKSDMSRVAQNERLIQLLESKTSMDTDAVNYTIMFSDPFFDGQVRHLNGLPDAKVGKSITTVVTQELQMSAPAGQTAPWSLLIQTNPWTFDPNTPGLTAARNATLHGNLVQFPVAPANLLERWPAVSCWRGDDGNPLGPFDFTTAGNVPPVGVGLPSNYTVGVHRVIGMALEYYDTTNPLNRQGSVRCYRQPTNSFENKSVINYATPSTGAVTAGGASSALLFRRPPRTPAEVSLLAGTVGWKAEDGFYMVCTPIEAEIPAKTCEDSQPVVVFNDFGTGTRDFTTSIPVMTGNTSPSPAGANARINSPSNVWNLIPWNSSGAFFTGLHPSHTGLLRVRWIVERFPSPDEADISLACQPCAEYCPEVFMTISRMMAEMPVAMGVNANGLGEWLSSALGWVFPTIKKALHYVTAPEPEKASRETKEIVRLSKAVEKMASNPKPIVVRKAGPTYETRAVNAVRREGVKLPPGVPQNTSGPPRKRTRARRKK